MKHDNDPLSRGSIISLVKVSVPMMISFFSVVLMLFVDRLYLSHHSLKSLNAAVHAGTIAWAFISFFGYLVAICEVYVAQRNGAKEHQLLGQPVWQMLWTCLFLIPVLGCIAYWIPSLLFTNLEASEKIYFSYTLFWGGVPFCFLSALNAFYIGRGRTNIVTWLSILANLINIVLDPLFIFGYDPYIPSMGVKGAAIATALGGWVQAGIIFLLFIRKTNKEKYGTGDYALRPKLLKKSLKLGLPAALSTGVEIAAWGCFYRIMTLSGEDNLSVAGILQSILILFFFVGMGLEKGVCALVGNLIGANKPKEVYAALRSAFMLVIIFTLVASIFFLIYPESLVSWFFSYSDIMADRSLESGVMQENIKSAVIAVLPIGFTYLILDTMRYAQIGVLTASGDTLFLLVVNVLSVWIFMVLPAYLYISNQWGPVNYVYYIWVFFSFLTFIVNTYRILKSKRIFHRLVA